MFLGESSDHQGNKNRFLANRCPNLSTRRVKWSLIVIENSSKSLDQGRNLPLIYIFLPPLILLHPLKLQMLQVRGEGAPRIVYATGPAQPWSGTVNVLTQGRRTGSPFASFWKAVLPTPKIRDVISEPVMDWMNNNWKHMSCLIISFRRLIWYTSKRESASGLHDFKYMLLPSPCA